MAEINSKIPEGPLADKWTNYKDHQKLVNPANKRRLDVIIVGTRTPRAAHTPSPHKVVSTQPRTIRTTATPSIASSTTPSRVVTIVPAKPTSIVWLKSRTPSSTNA